MRPSRRHLLAGSAAAFATQPLRVSGQTPTHLIVATPPVDGGIGALVGLRGGFFTSYGLDVELHAVSSGAAQAAAVVGGALNIGASNILGLITAHVKGVPFQIIAPGGMYLTEKPAEMLVVRNDGAVRTAADLNGKTLASSALGDLDSVAALAWIDQHGGDSKSVRRVELPAAATPAALEAGRIDAAGLQEPRLSEGLRSGRIRALGPMYDAIGKRFMVSAEFTTAEWANANRDVIRRYYRAQLEADAFANKHQDQTAHWLAEFANADLDTILHNPRKMLAETLDISMIQPVIDAAVRYKVIDRAFDPRELISPAILDR